MSIGINPYFIRIYVSHLDPTALVFLVNQHCEELSDRGTSGLRELVYMQTRITCKPPYAANGSASRELPNATRRENYVESSDFPSTTPTIAGTARYAYKSLLKDSRDLTTAPPCSEAKPNASGVSCTERQPPLRGHLLIALLR